MPDILFFDAVTDADAGRVGGKGLSLARMAAAGLPVPPGFVVTTDAYRRQAASTRPPADLPAAAPVAPAAGGAAPGAAAPAAPNLDELARKLYDPLAARLKAELRLDRERAGLVTDLRR